MQSTLGKAIALWRSGRNVSFHMAMDLREQGYDVAALATAHRNYAPTAASSIETAI